MFQFQNNNRLYLNRCGLGLVIIQEERGFLKEQKRVNEKLDQFILSKLN